MESYKMLDSVLSILNSAYIKSITPIVIDDGVGRSTTLPDAKARYMSPGAIVVELAVRQYEQEAWNVNLMLDYLLKKGMILTSDGSALPGAWTVKYVISWEGHVLIENGGYEGLQKEKERAKRIEILKEVLLIVGTVLGGVGAIAIFWH